jgi:hypothetical protein
MIQNLLKQIELLKNQLLDLIIKKNNLKKLHDIALQSIGLDVDVSPSDFAPDELGCAETISNLIRKIVPSFPIILGTWTLYGEFKRNSRFKRITEPETGAIIISPTGFGNGKFPGHVGIVGENGKIMSNDSKTGKFIQNYTLKTWAERYAIKGGFPIFYFKLI